MKSGLTPGVATERTFTVTPEMCPHFHDRLHHPVCATWTVVHHMELTGRQLLEPHLDEDEEAVGAHISIDHRAPALIGAEVRVRAEVESLSHQRLTTRMSARCGERLIASGVFVQVLMPKKRLETLLQQARLQP